MQYAGNRDGFMSFVTRPNIFYLPEIVTQIVICLDSTNAGTCKKKKKKEYLPYQTAVNLKTDKIEG